MLARAYSALTQLLKIVSGTDLAVFLIMYRKTTIIPFPGQREREVRQARLKTEAAQRAAALPEALRELQVAWIFEEAARREKESDRQT